MYPGQQWHQQPSRREVVERSRSPIDPARDYHRPAGIQSTYTGAGDVAVTHPRASSTQNSAGAARAAAAARSARAATRLGPAWLQRTSEEAPMPPAVVLEVAKS